MTITKHLTISGPRRIMGLLLALALLVSAAGAVPATSVPTEPYFEGDGASSDGVDLSIWKAWQQGFRDGAEDGASSWRGYILEIRLKAHHYNDAQAAAYTSGYNWGYKFAKGEVGCATPRARG